MCCCVVCYGICLFRSNFSLVVLGCSVGRWICRMYCCWLVCSFELCWFIVFLFCCSVVVNLFGWFCLCFLCFLLMCCYGRCRYCCNVRVIFFVVRMNNLVFLGLFCWWFFVLVLFVVVVVYLRNLCLVCLLLSYW